MSSTKNNQQEVQLTHSGNVAVTLLNLSSAIEAELQSQVEKSSWKVFGSTNVTKADVKEGLTYSFGPIDLPELISNELFGWMMFIRGNDGNTKKYLVSLNISNKITGEVYCDFGSIITKECFDMVNKIYKNYEKSKK